MSMTMEENSCDRKSFSNRKSYYDDESFGNSKRISNWAISGD